MCAAVLLGLALAEPGQAQPRGGRAEGATRQASALEAARRFLCPNGGRPVRGQRGRCAPASRGGSLAAGGMAGWDAGLPPPDRRQAACPEGTVAAAARDRPESIRCLPR